MKNLLILDANLNWNSFIDMPAAKTGYQAIEYFYDLTDEQLNSIYKNPLFWSTERVHGESVLNALIDMEVTPFDGRSSGSYNLGSDKPKLDDELYAGKIREIIAQTKPDRVVRLFIRKPWTRAETVLRNSKTLERLDPRKYFKTVQNRRPYLKSMETDELLTFGPTRNFDVMETRVCQILCGWQDVDKDTLEITTALTHPTAGVKFAEFDDLSRHMSMEDILGFLALRKNFKQTRTMTEMFTVNSVYTDFSRQYPTFEQAVETMRQEIPNIKHLVHIDAQYKPYFKYLRFGISKDNTNCAMFVFSSLARQEGVEVPIIPVTVQGRRMSISARQPIIFMEIKKVKKAVNRIMESSDGKLPEWFRLLDRITPYGEYQI